MDTIRGIFWSNVPSLSIFMRNLRRGWPMWLLIFIKTLFSFMKLPSVSNASKIWPIFSFFDSVLCSPPLPFSNFCFSSPFNLSSKRLRICPKMVMLESCDSSELNPASWKRSYTWLVPKKELELWINLPSQLYNNLHTQMKSFIVQWHEWFGFFFL